MAAFAILLRETLIVTAVLVLPILGIATLVGALVAIVQAATQIQEQTPFSRLNLRLVIPSTGEPLDGRGLLQASLG